MDIHTFCRQLPKVELHAHLNGSLSHNTMLELKRYHVDKGLEDKTDAFFDEFQIGAGDRRTLTDCFQVFGIAHKLTTTPEALALATSLTLKEFQDDGCCYIELRSTPRETPHISKRQYIDAIVNAILNASQKLLIVSCLIISIDRRLSKEVAEEILMLALEYHKLHPDIVVGVELSGDPMIGKFSDFVDLFKKARSNGLKVTLHCGEVCNPDEVLEMLTFNPERIGHAVCVHPKYGGTPETWQALCERKIPVEVCLTSNINTKSTPSYDSHHLKYLLDANIPVIICTDDKGVFATSLSQEYMICAETFNLDRHQLMQLSLHASKYIFIENVRKNIYGKIQNFVQNNS